LRSPTGLLSTGGPIDGIVDGVMSIESRGGVKEEPEDEGSIGMDLCMAEPWGSAEKGLRRMESAVDAIFSVDR